VLPQDTGKGKDEKETPTHFLDTRKCELGSERDCSFSLHFHGIRMKRVSCSLTLREDAERAQCCSIVGLSPLTLNMETKDRSVSELSG